MCQTPRSTFEELLAFFNWQFTESKLFLEAHHSVLVVRKAFVCN